MNQLTTCLKIKHLDLKTLHFDICLTRYLLQTRKVFCFNYLLMGGFLCDIRYELKKFSNSPALYKFIL